MPRLPPTATARSLSRTKAVDLPWTLPAASPPPCRRLGQDSAKPNPFFFLITLTARPAFPIQSRPVISGRVSGHLLKNLIFFYSTSFDQKPPKSSLWSEKINILVFSFGRFLWVIWADNKIAWQFFFNGIHWQNSFYLFHVVYKHGNKFSSFGFLWKICLRTDIPVSRINIIHPNTAGPTGRKPMEPPPSSTTAARHRNSTTVTYMPGRRLC